MSNQTHPTDFPHSAPAPDQLRFLLHYAVLAPSSHNTQPWLWEIEGDEVVLRADRSRAMPALDPQGRELIMSCGAALQHLCLATRAFGYATIVRLFPDPNQPDELARVRLAAARPATAEDELLFRFITKRHTHRGEFEARLLPLELLHALQDEAEEEGATLHFAHRPEQRDALIELIERGDISQSHDPAVRRDIAAWIAPQGERDDGIPTGALGISDWLSHAAPIAHRLLDRGEILGEQDRKMAENAPVLAVLSTSGDEPRSWLAAGQALGRVLLRARAESVWASFFSQPIQVDEAWTQMRHMVGVHHFPQLVFRLGYAQSVPATPRRAVDEVATIAEPPQDLS